MKEIDALALSEDQAIFFPKAPCLALLDKLDDSLDKSIMLEPFYDAVSEVSLRLGKIGKFILMTQRIGRQVGRPNLYSMA